MGAYSRWALIRGWALIKFSTFSARAVCLFCNKTINGNNKTRRFNKERFPKKYFEENSIFGEVSYQYLFSFGRAGVGVGAYLSLSGSGREVGWGGRLLTFSAFRMGAY